MGKLDCLGVKLPPFPLVDEPLITPRNLLRGCLIEVASYIATNVIFRYAEAM